MATTLEGSTALVTGATAGIGMAIAQQLAALGAKVVARMEGRNRACAVKARNPGLVPCRNDPH